jgi:hypothetical protein
MTFAKLVVFAISTFGYTKTLPSRGLSCANALISALVIRSDPTAPTSQLKYCRPYHR